MNKVRKVSNQKKKKTTIILLLLHQHCVCVCGPQAASCVSFSLCGFLLKCEPKNVLTLTHPQALCVCVCLNVLIHSDLICCHRHRRSCADSANHHSFPFSSFPSHHSSNCIFFSVFAPLHTHTRKLHFPRHVVININSWCRVSHESFM